MEVAMSLPERKRLERKLTLPPMIMAIEKATAVLIFKQRYKLESLRRVKELTLIPPSERYGKLEQIIGD
tara:strand:+ start:942 stop:1148 length:207 start_codon:yes stop_codon:yes gene_type:complete